MIAQGSLSVDFMLMMMWPKGSRVFSLHCVSVALIALLYWVAVTGLQGLGLSCLRRTEDIVSHAYDGSSMLWLQSAGM